MNKVNSKSFKRMKLLVHCLHFDKKLLQKYNNYHISGEALYQIKDSSGFVGVGTGW